jgi:FKBP-type peptidyl-prolyl cis-trans isomerase (trigger factor)
MAASLENALKTIKDSSVVVSGFRPGKAPAQLLRKKKTPMAIDTMLHWILQDLGEVLDSYDSFQILTPGNFSFEPSWREGEPFRVEATFNCWLFPDLSTDDIFEAIAEEATNQGRVVDTGAESLDWLGDVLGQLFVPHIPLEVQGLMIQFYLDQKGSKGSNDEREEALVEVSRILGAAFMIKRLGIETSEDDIEKGIGLVASEIGASFYDLYDELMDEAGLQNYRQHLQMMAALSAIARRVSVRQSNEKTAPPVADREVTTP